MTLNGVMAVILRYFSEFAYLPGVLRKSSRSLSHLLKSSCAVCRDVARRKGSSATLILTYSFSQGNMLRVPSFDGRMLLTSTLERSPPANCGFVLVF